MKANRAIASQIKAGQTTTLKSSQAIQKKSSQPGYKMEKLFLLMVMLATCSAGEKGMRGKVFVFPRESNTDRVKLLTTKEGFSGVTVCLRFITDLSRDYGLFSLATPSHSNDFVLFKATDVMRIHARDAGTDFLSLSFPRNQWHSMCATWSSENGVAQLWVDGKPGIKRYIHSGQSISGTPIIILGQEQDTYGGSFDAKQSFLGMIHDVHMWDYAIPEHSIKLYMDQIGGEKGNVLNWDELEYEITGKVLVEQEPQIKVWGVKQ